MVAVPQLEYVVISLTTRSAATGFNARKCTSGAFFRTLDLGIFERFALRSLELIQELPFGANNPSRLIPHSPPIHLVVVEVGSFAARCLLTFPARVSDSADALAIVPIALTTA